MNHTEINRLYRRVSYLSEVLDDAVYEADQRNNERALNDALPAFTVMLEDSIEHLKALGYTMPSFDCGDK